MDLTVIERNFQLPSALVILLTRESKMRLFARKVMNIDDFQILQELKGI